MSVKNPVKFNDLKPEELYRSAIEDFALPIREEDKGKKQVLVAAFAEGGVSWDDYVSQHPEFAPAVSAPPAPPVDPAAPTNATNGVAEHDVTQRIPEPARGGVVTTGNINGTEDPLSVEPVESINIIVAEPVAATSRDMFLIKMIRENPLYEVRGHKFTSTHPYALVSPDDYEYILNHEDGFRQATPSELQEFYG